MNLIDQGLPGFRKYMLFRAKHQKTHGDLCKRIRNLRPRWHIIQHLENLQTEKIEETFEINPELCSNLQFSFTDLPLIPADWEVRSMRYESFSLKDSIHVEFCGNCKRILSAVEKVADTCYTCGSNLMLSGINELYPSDLGSLLMENSGRIDI
jgi:hypothetical protein